jgi:hypothetical protein
MSSFLTGDDFHPSGPFVNGRNTKFTWHFTEFACQGQQIPAILRYAAFSQKDDNKKSNMYCFLTQLSCPSALMMNFYKEFVASAKLNWNKGINWVRDGARKE